MSYAIHEDDEWKGLPDEVDGFPVAGWWHDTYGYAYPKFGVELYGQGCPTDPGHVVHVAGDRFADVEETVFWHFCETCESEL